MLRVVRVTTDWVSFADTGGWTSAVPVKESEVLKNLEVAIWEETSSVHFYAFPNDYDAGYGYHPRRTDEQSIAYREQFLIEKYLDMPPSGTAERSNFMKLAFIDIASHLVDQYPNADHHLMFNGHGGPGGALFGGSLSKQDAYNLLDSWSHLLGRKLGVIDMGGPCTKGSFADLENFCEFTEYYIASDMPNGGYTMDDFTGEKYDETNPETQYHDLFRSHASLESVLKARVDLNRKAYEYSKTNMITNQVAQANYLYSCSAFRIFQPKFEEFLAAINVDYQIVDDAYQYMVNNNASSDLKKSFDSVIVHKVDNSDFFDWAYASNVPNKYLRGMLMPLPANKPIQVTIPPTPTATPIPTPTVAPIPFVPITSSENFICEDKITHKYCTSSELHVPPNRPPEIWGSKVGFSPEVFCGYDVSDAECELVISSLLSAMMAWGNYGPVEYWVLGPTVEALQNLAELNCKRRSERGDFGDVSECIFVQLSGLFEFKLEYYRSVSAGEIPNRTWEAGRNGNINWGIHYFNSSLPGLGWGARKSVFHEYFHAVQHAHIQSKDYDTRYNSKEIRGPFFFVEAGADYMAFSALKKAYESGDLPADEDPYVFEKTMENLLDLDIPNYRPYVWYFALLANRFGQDILLDTFYPNLEELGWVDAFTKSYGVDHRVFWDDFLEFLELPRADQLEILTH
tara:strand:- start:336 stop:2387 length:2052 start_codon:yes stop_codon:yes gene_type:complete